MVERAVLMAGDGPVRATDLILRPPGTQAAARGLDEMTLEEVEAVLVHKALARHGGNVSLAARDLGLSRSALYRRLQKYGLGS